jgi:hypothetical protein
MMPGTWAGTTRPPPRNSASTDQPPHLFEPTTYSSSYALGSLSNPDVERCASSRVLIRSSANLTPTFVVVDLFVRIQALRLLKQRIS